MPTETHNFTYDTNAESVTVTATMRDADGNILDTITQTVDVPEIDNGNLKIATTTNDFAPSVESMTQNLPNGAFTIIGSALSASNIITDQEFQNVTDQQIRTTLQNYIQNHADFLNENTIGKVLLDIEHPRNFAEIENISDNDLDWFVDGVKRRVSILRELLPNARLGLYAVGSPQSQGSLTDEKKSKYVRALNRGLLDNVDFISPVLYSRFGPNDSNYGKVLAGVSARQCRELCDHILQNGQSVGVHPLVTPRIYNGNSNENGQLAQRELIEEKMRFMREAPLLKSRYKINQVILWFHPTNDGFDFAEQEAEYYRSLNYALPENIRFYLSSPRTENQVLNNNAKTVSFRHDFTENTSIPKDEAGYTYWATAQENDWTDAINQEIDDGNAGEEWRNNTNFFPTTPEQFERMVFSGVDEDGNIDSTDSYPSFAKNWLLLNDGFISQSYTIPERDIAALDHEFLALFFCLRNQFLLEYRNENYELDGTPTDRADAPIQSPFKEGQEKWYALQNVNKYPVDEWMFTWFPIVMNANKRFARMFRKRYGFKKIALYGLGGYAGWWEGLTQNAFDNPSQYGLPDGQTYRGWMKYSTIRTLQEWENAEIFAESSPGAGDYFDKIMCSPKVDIPTNYWGFPNGEDRGLEVVIREMVEAFRPWKDKTLLLLNNYYSSQGLQDLTGPCMVDQYHDWLEGRTSHTALGGAQRINVNYREADGTQPGNMSEVSVPPKLIEEQNYLNKYWFKYASDFELCDFNFEWVDFLRWDNLPDNSKKKYWVQGYDGEYSNQDKYSFLYKQLYLPWYQRLWNDYTTTTPPAGEPILFVSSFGGLGNMPYPTHDSDGGNSFAGYARFDDESINSDAITRSFLNSGTPKSTTGRKLSRTRTIDDDGYRSSYEAATTAVEKAELHANNSEDGVQHLINHYFEPGYKVGYRRFLYWTPSGNIAGTHTLFGNSHPDNHLNFSADWVVSGNTTKPGTFNQGRGMYPSTSWTAMGLQDPDGNDTVVTDSWAREMADLGYFNPIETGYKIPWTTNGYPEGWFESGGSFAFAWNTEGEGPDNWRSKDGQEKRSRQDSWKTFMKDWIDSKTELGDPVVFYIYNGGLVPYKSINGADETNPNGGDPDDIDWGNLGSVKWEGSDPNDAGGPSEGWIDDGLITNERFTEDRFSFLHPHRKFVQPRINPDGTWNSSGDQRFYEENYLPWISEVGIKGFWIDATPDMIRTNPGQRQWFLNNGIEVGTEALDWAQTEFAAGSGLGAGRNRWFPRTNFLEMPYLALLNNGSTYAETRGWQNFNWKTGKMYVPRPDLGGIPQPNGSISLMTNDNATTVRGLEPGSGPEQDLVFFDGSPYDPSNPPEVYIWLIWGNGNPSVADSGWAAKHRLKDSSGNLIKRTTGPTTVPVGFELTTTNPNTFDRTLFDGDGSGFNEALGRYYNEFLMKQELDELIDKGYTPSNNLGNTDNTASGGIILNEGLNVEDYNIFARVQKYINARLSGLSSDDPEATKWLFLDIYDENGDIIITTSSV
jgi:hypothetical protein